MEETKKDWKLCTAGADPKHNSKEITFLEPESSKIKGATKLRTTKLATTKTRNGLKDSEFP